MAFWNRRKKQKKQQEEQLWEEQVQKAQEVFERRRQEKLQQQAEKKLQKESAQIREAEGTASTVSIQGLLEEIQGEEWMPADTGECKRIAKECCEAIREIDSQKDKVQEEYEKVTSRLRDIQILDGVVGEEREALEGLCKKLMRLNKEREAYTQRTLTISDALVRHFDGYEDILAEEVKKMYQGELYQKSIEGDMEKLEKEKKKLQRQQKQAQENQKALQQMAKVLIALIISLFALFVVLYYAWKTDMTMPYLGTILLAAISALVIFLESGKNRKNVAVAHLKMNRAIALLNRVKIKYINNRNLLDYNCAKFQVKSAADFEEKWIEYSKAKEYERKFRENTKQMERSRKQLTEWLKAYKLQEPELWIHQTVAVVDAKEMVEVRHGLNVQRGKLREQISDNEIARNMMLQKLDEIMEKNPDMTREMIALIQKYQA